jgi:dihydroorotate dehydrogenase electron transfer subunit
MLGPLGNGFPLPDRGVLPVLVAGGCGFPPLHFLSLRLRQKRIPATMFIGAKNRSGLPPAGVIRSLKQNLSTVRVATEDGSAGTRGMVTQILSAYLENAEQASVRRPVIYACGPRSMLAVVSRIAAEHSVTCHVSMEERMACGLGACMGCSVAMKQGGYKRVCKDGPVFSAEEIAWSESDANNPSSVAQCCTGTNDAMMS